MPEKTDTPTAAAPTKQPADTPQAPTAQPQTRRDQLLAALSKVKTVKINTPREFLFVVRASWFDDRSNVLLGLNRRSPVATFGANGTMALAQMPDHALESIYRGLLNGEIVDATGTADQATHAAPVTIEPLPRVAGGRDPVLASGIEADTLEAVLLPPKPSDSRDPDGAVIDRIRESVYASDRKALVALEYLERCRRNRSRVLVALDDMIEASSTVAH